MSSPKAIVQIFITGTRILGKAFWEAGKQAVKNAKHSPQAALGNDAAGVGTATSGSVTDSLTRLHRMTLDEAQLILNVKRGDSMETVTKQHEHLFKINSPPVKAEPAAGKQSQVYHSHYLQSKVFRALERLEAEMKTTSQEAAQTSSEASSTQTPPPPPESPSGLP